MEVALVVDKSRPRELAHARSQAVRLRRIGLGVSGLSGGPGGDVGSAGVVYAVGPSAWRRSRRLARRARKPLVYDHPPGTDLPRGLGRADGGIAAGPTDVERLQSRLGNGAQAVVVPPGRHEGGFRPRLLRRLGIDEHTVALQEVAGLSSVQGEAIVSAIARTPHVELVFLGGARWGHKAAMLERAKQLAVVERIHFAGGVPAMRRMDYLAQADIGLALADGRVRHSDLPAEDVFELLGIPFVTTRYRDPEALGAAIVRASERGSLPPMDGERMLETLVFSVAVPPVEQRASTEPQRLALLRSDEATDGLLSDQATADALLSKAKRLRAEGDEHGAVALYRRVAVESQASVAVATAAAGLARQSARDEAWEAIDRVMHAPRRPSLAIARAGEAAAVLGDLVLACSCADEVVEDPDASSLALRNAIRVFEQAGEPRVALGVARRIADAPGVARIEGALGSYDPSWLPASSRARIPTRPRSGRSLALLETSLPYVRSGYTYRARTLLRAQRRAGVEPTVLTRLGFPASRGLSAVSREEVDGVVHHRADLPGVKQYTSVPITEQLAENVRWAVGVAEEVRPEGIIAATPHLNGIVGLALRRELGIPLIYDVRGFPEMTWAVRKGGGETDAFGLRRVAETRCMREADLVVTLSETMRQQIIGRGVSADRVHVLPHAVDTDAFSPRERDPELAVSLGLGARPVVGYISSLVPYEGVEILVEAIALARQSNPEIAGVIVGDGELLASLKARAGRLGLDGHVVFPGRVEASEVMRYYSLADIFVCPRQDHEVTRYVTPLKPFEAMAAGSCIAVSDLPTLREAVCDGECGALFPAGDAVALARTIVDLIERPERRQALGGAARGHVLANHDFDTLCSRFADVWGELRRCSEVEAA